MPSFMLNFFGLERSTRRRHFPGACFFGMTPNGLQCTQDATSAGKGPITLPSETSSWRYCVTTSHPVVVLFACLVTVQALQSLMFLPPRICFLQVPELLYWMIRAHLSQLSQVSRCELPACGELWAALLPPGTALVESALVLMEDFPRCLSSLSLEVEEEGKLVD